MEITKKCLSRRNRQITLKEAHFGTDSSPYAGCSSICVQVFGDTLREVDDSPLLCKSKFHFLFAAVRELVEIAKQ